MAKMKSIPFNKLLDKEFGKTGKLDRDLFELAVESRVLGQRLRDMRLARGWTQEQVGKLIGVGKSRINRLEKGDGNITLNTLKRVFRAFEMNVSLKVRRQFNEVGDIPNKQT